MPANRHLKHISKSSPYFNKLQGGAKQAGRSVCEPVDDTTAMALSKKFTDAMNKPDLTAIGSFTITIGPNFSGQAHDILPNKK